MRTPRSFRSEGLVDCLVNRKLIRDSFDVGFIV